MTPGKPAIVIPVYKRVKALKRLLNSLLNAHYPSNDVPIVFSKEGNSSPKVHDFVESFNWPFGQKIIRKQPQQLGLDQHLLKCASYSKEFGSVIVIEDDLFMAPYFYDYAQAAANYYLDDERIAGISLYSYNLHPYEQKPFDPLIEGNQPHFIQKLPTWGEIWTQNQWATFEAWWQANDYHLPPARPNLPNNLEAYQDHYWEKIYNTFLIETNRYFVFPPNSYSTNFSEIGTHVKNPIEENVYQVSLQIGAQLPNFQTIEQSNGIYDAYFELLPAQMKVLNPKLVPYDFAVDLYGSKQLEEIDKPYVLSCKIATNPEMSFGRNLKPHELNIAYDIEGNDLYLAKKENFSASFFDHWRRQLRAHYYHYPETGIMNLLKMKLLEILSRFFHGLWDNR